MEDFDIIKHHPAYGMSCCRCNNHLTNCVVFKNTGPVCLDCGMEYEVVGFSLYYTRKQKGELTWDKLQKAREIEHRLCKINNFELLRLDMITKKEYLKRCKEAAAKEAEKQRQENIALYNMLKQKYGEK